MLNYIDLFSGAGGMSCGFEKAGFENIFSLEFNPEFAETYKKNFPKNNLIVKDIADISEPEVKK